MSKPSRADVAGIPFVTNGSVKALYPDAAVRRNDLTVGGLIESLSSVGYIQAPFDSGVEGTAARNAEYYRLVVPSRESVPPRNGLQVMVIELANGRYERVAALKEEVRRRLGEMASRPVVRELSGMVGPEIVGRVRDQRWYDIIAGVAAGFAVDGGYSDEPLISLVYSRKLNQTEHLLNQHIVYKQNGGQEIPVWLSGVVSDEAVLSSDEARTRRLAGMMAQSLLLNTLDD